ncbi:MAG: hypothetical protein A3I11_03460 [Elusimicrobia bacterium RIFCSPLOWO2_02_FULL_39_32]|nr:MAG: hypothetical protein A2034_04420 [Elusimicrobia bacterium GWA2_38_7]OGR79438.1 MAG: hypothetical protein A3B80_02030 [Elusimicrobia bacterium RIFCSPHIGHO2_02_FULL_39_36]OGR92765.1 MAG: hypothetical protein A3I11_03460 [Elusimicrobia bacterium RIFCSPLOWO2_02_FULL_39_32]OGR99550.1 MAG: hypothetical protein A3G85_00815 [Elusimicrobia bacterium RIFCSPLOWO2_12_FULL_39_28]
MKISFLNFKFKTLKRRSQNLSVLISKNLLIIFLFTTLYFIPSIHAAIDTQIKERKQFGKSIRTRMPPQIIIDTVQKAFHARSPEWKTFWQTFVVEDDENKNEYVIVARSVEKPWAFSLNKGNCDKPENYEELMNQINSGGTPLRIDALIGVKKDRSWFRYTINIYEPMYSNWKNPCYLWNLPPGKGSDPFYNKNYNMQVYSQNLKKDIVELVKSFENWKPPKKPKKIPAIKGSGQEIIGGEADLLTDEERKLSIEEQEKILKNRVKEQKKKHWWFSKD